MKNIFEITDVTNRKIRLTINRWKHISQEHPEVTEINEIILALIEPTIIKPSKYDLNVRWYYLYNKDKRRYLMVSVKYLNGDGFIITSYYMRNIL